MGKGEAKLQSVVQLAATISAAWRLHLAGTLWRPKKLWTFLLLVSLQRLQRIMGLPRGHGSARNCSHPKMDMAMRFL